MGHASTFFDSSLTYWSSTVNVGVNGFKFRASIYDQEARFPKFSYDFFSNELSHIVAFVLFGGLCHGPSGCIVNSCDDVLLALVFARHWYHNIQ
ncbi:hypothetical protein DSO57_1005739 [Entomophthora muscae]|uniref:Uncharacterized protein n=1 Tax=Entomophthora muscae TaxID=34485 RepID=A0ACC2T850_9FUNG|nr:hypothetical protein DSO57_1005739 [Entomophthora muscae]